MQKKLGILWLGTMGGGDKVVVVVVFIGEGEEGEKGKKEKGKKVMM